jgi:hypothetical protein
MDPLQSFQRTGRKISLGFDVVAGSSQEAYNNLDRISLLLQMLYPSYEAGRGGATSIKAAPYFKISFMNLVSSFISEGETGAELSGLLGTVDGFTYSPNLDAGFYHGGKGGKGSLFPKVVNLSCTFTVLHQGKLGWVKKEQRDKFRQFPYKEAPASFGQSFADEDPFADEIPKTEDQIKNDANDVMLEATATEILSSTTVTTHTTKKMGKVVKQKTTTKSTGVAKNAMGQPVGSPPSPPPPPKKPDWNKLLKERNKRISEADTSW